MQIRYLSGVLLATLLVTGLTVAAFAQGPEGKRGVGRYADTRDPNRQLWQAASDGDLSTVQSALAKGGQVDFHGKRGFTPLAIAAKNGHLDVVKFMLDRGANIDDRDNDRHKTPLLAASFDGHLDVVKYLVDHGANVNMQAINSWTPLHDAAYRGLVDIVKYLVDHGADLAVKNNRDETPLQTAQRGQYDAVRRRQTDATPADYKEVIDYIKTHQK